MKKNAWSVEQEVCQHIHMESGPAGDLMLAMVENNNHLFYNTQYLVQFHKASKTKKTSVPGYQYIY